MRPIKIFSAICLMGLASIFISACSKEDAGGGVNVAQNVGITATGFSPATITIARGLMITWKNNDTAPHTVTSDDGTSFSSGSIAAGGTFSFTPTVTGSFPYHCSLHAAETGIVQVVIR